MSKITHRPMWLARLAMVSTILVFSCNQENNIKPTALDEQNSNYELAESILTPFAKAALKFATDQSMKLAVHSEVEKQFDGDFNVLFETLLVPSESNLRSTSALSREETDELTEAISLLAEVAGDGIYPQIYIPYFENHTEPEGISNSRSANTNASPVIVIYTGDESKEEWPGYLLNASGELENVGFLIDEDYAEQNEVWVISFNERIENGEVVAYIENSANSRIAAEVNGIISRIDIHCRKESWTSGKHDIHIRRYTTWYGAIDPISGQSGIYNRLGTSSPTGQKIVDVKIKNKHGI